MTRWLAGLLACGAMLAPGTGHSATVEPFAPMPVENERASLDLRLVAEPRYGTRPIRQSGMVASAPIAPNTEIGLGLFKSSQRRPDAGEWRAEGRTTGSRKAAVRLQVKF